MARRRVLVRTAVGKSRLDGLRALRDQLAAEIDAGPPEKGASQTAALSRQWDAFAHAIAEQWIAETIEPGQGTDKRSVRPGDRKPT